MYSIVFLRHGQSLWNLENRFTGWTDVDLTLQGEAEAREAGRVLLKGGFTFDLCCTSVLKRAIRTLHLCLEVMDLLYLPEIKHWRLNERHYGALQGVNKAEMAEKYGDEQVFIWRRSYDTPPPPLDSADPRNPRFDPRYAGEDPAVLPLTESLKDTVARVLPYWNETIAPAIKAGRKILVSAHGNSLRALVKHLDGMSEEEVSLLNIPTGVPMVYTLDERLQSLGRRYLGDPEVVEAKTKAVADQAKSGRKG